MNKRKRAVLSKAVWKLRDAKDDIESVKDLEENAYENLTDNLKETLMGQKLESYACDLSDICDEIENIVSGVEEIIND